MAMLLAAACEDQMIHVWNVEQEQEVATLRGHTGDVLSVAWHPQDQRLASASNDGTAKIWDIQQHTERATVAASGVSSLAWNPQCR